MTASMFAMTLRETGNAPRPSQQAQERASPPSANFADEQDPDLVTALQQPTPASEATQECNGSSSLTHRNHVRDHTHGSKRDSSTFQTTPAVHTSCRQQPTETGCSN